MCGRFALGVPRHGIVEMVQRAHPDMDLADWVDEDQFQPRYNIAPRSRSPVIRRADQGPQAGPAPRDDNNASTSAQVDAVVRSSSQPAKPKYIMHTMKWGLVPFWSKHEDKTLSTVNARAENLVEGSGMWNSMRGKKRCVVVCQGYYEWQKKGKDKIPHFVRFKDGSLMLLAGLYDVAHLESTSPDQTNDPLWTFTIVTTDAPKSLTWLHDRQPVILSSHEALERWLDCGSGTWSKELSRLCLPYTDNVHPLDCYPVPADVGKVGNESATFIEPVSKRKDGIEAMFKKQVQKGDKEETKRSSASPKREGKDKVGGKRKREDGAEGGDDTKEDAKKKVKKDDEDNKSEEELVGDDDNNAPDSPVSTALKGKTKTKGELEDIDMSSDIEIIETKSVKSGSQADRTKSKKESETRTPKVNKSTAGSKAKQMQTPTKAAPKSPKSTPKAKSSKNTTSASSGSGAASGSGRITQFFGKGK